MPSSLLSLDFYVLTAVSNSSLQRWIGVSYNDRLTLSGRSSKYRTSSFQSFNIKQQEIEIQFVSNQYGVNLLSKQVNKGSLVVQCG